MAPRRGKLPSCQNAKLLFTFHRKHVSSCGRPPHRMTQVVPHPAPHNAVVPSEEAQHDLVQRQRLKAEGYLRNRAVRKERQQRQVLLLGTTVTGLGMVTFFLIFRIQQPPRG